MNLNEMDKRAKQLDNLAAAAFPSKGMKAKLAKFGKKVKRVAREQGMNKNDAAEMEFDRLRVRAANRRQEERIQSDRAREAEKEKKRGTHMKEENIMTLKEYYKEILSGRAEQLDELSDDLMKRYLNRATSFTPGHSNSTTGISVSLDRIKRAMTPPAWGITKESDPNTDEFYRLERKQRALQKKLGRREKGINRAKKQLGLSEEGKLATTPKEKELAALHGDPKRITRGDVIKGALRKKN
jgi:hypothetical protein